MMLRTTSSGMLIAASATMLLVAAPLSAQEDPQRDTTTQPGLGVFGTLAPGVATPGLGGLLSLSVHWSGSVVILRSSGAAEYTFFEPGDLAEDYALLFGRVREGERGWLRAAVGPSFVRVVRYGPGYDCWLFFCHYDAMRSEHLGLAIQAEAVWTPADVFGLGLAAFADVNGGMSYAGLALGVHLGKVRRR